MIKAVTGTRDILPVDIPKWKYLESIIESVFSLYNYKEIRTPVFEETALFARGIGEATDIVSKEMYTFADRSGESLTLRPEMTAGVVRAFIEHSLEKKQNLNKLYYISPMFRQERPQAGRFRQFHQFGAEAIGSNDPLLDAEMIIMAYEIFKSLGLKNLLVKINSLGVPASREEYKKLLAEFLKPHFNKLSSESKKRFETNILRIFDSKEEEDQKIMADAPLMIDHLDEESLSHFAKVKEALISSQIPFELDAKLVRGLDYYTNTTFEVVSGSVGSQSALCGGGRYNGLVKELGGNDVPGVGFAAGMERILLACENEKAFSIQDEEIDIYIVTLQKGLQNVAYKTAVDFRRQGYTVELDYLDRSVKSQMREANRLKANNVIMFGGDEYSDGNVIMKDMEAEIEGVLPLREILKLNKKGLITLVRRSNQIIDKINNLPFLELMIDHRTNLVSLSNFQENKEQISPQDIRGIYLIYHYKEEKPILIGITNDLKKRIKSITNNKNSELIKKISKKFGTKELDPDFIAQEIRVKFYPIKKAKVLRRMLQAYFEI